MKHVKIILLFIITGCMYSGIAQDSKDYIEFNDRRNIVHGVYLGVNVAYGEIKDKETYIMGLKVAYVANRQFEVGFVVKALYSNQDASGIFTSNNADLAAFYSGLHLEPILFSKAKINLSFPVLIGGGATGFFDSDWEDEEEFERNQEENWDAVFVVEPGVNILYNISRYVQLEAGIKYRFSSKVELPTDAISRINGFSAGIGLKLGVFNLGRNRYKKNIPNNE